MENIKLIIAKNVKKLRLKQRLTQMELADRAGLHYNYIGRIENAQNNISVETLEKLSKALKIEMERLISRK